MHGPTHGTHPTNHGATTPTTMERCRGQRETDNTNTMSHKWFTRVRGQPQLAQHRTQTLDSDDREACLSKHTTPAPNININTSTSTSTPTSTTNNQQPTTNTPQHQHNVANNHSSTYDGRRAGPTLRHVPMMGRQDLHEGHTVLQVTAAHVGR